MSRFPLGALLLWLGPSAGVGTLTAQTRSPATDGGIVVDTIASVTSRHLETPRMVRVYLPGGYSAGTNRYPVLYSNDGQDMESVGLVGSLDSLVEAGLIEPLIVVAVHATSERLQEYGTAGQPNAQGLGSRARAYEDFIVGELMPLVERRYRARSGPRSYRHHGMVAWRTLRFRRCLATERQVWLSGSIVGFVLVANRRQQRRRQAVLSHHAPESSRDTSSSPLESLV